MFSSWLFPPLREIKAISQSAPRWRDHSEFDLCYPYWAILWNWKWDHEKKRVKKSQFISVHAKNLYHNFFYACKKKKPRSD